MKGSPRTYVLTAKGERFVALMRLGVISQTGPIADGRGRKPSRWMCPICHRRAAVTAIGLVKVHAVRGKECRGTGRQAVARGA